MRAAAHKMVVRKKYEVTPKVMQKTFGVTSFFTITCLYPFRTPVLHWAKPLCAQERSKAETFYLLFFGFPFGDGLRYFLVDVGMNHDSLRCRRTNIFATAASYTYCRFYMRDSQSVYIGNHAYRLCRAMFGTGAAIGMFFVNDTIGLGEMRNAHLSYMFLLAG